MILVMKVVVYSDFFLNMDSGFDVIPESKFYCLRCILKPFWTSFYELRNRELFIQGIEKYKNSTQCLYDQCIEPLVIRELVKGLQNNTLPIKSYIAP